METIRRSIESYVSPEAWYHYARRRLDPAPFRLAHDHDAYEMFLVVRGAAQHWVAGETEELVVGDVVCMRPWDMHALRASHAGRCEIVNVMFRPAVADHLALRYPEETRGRFFWHDGDRPVRLHLSGPRLERAANMLSELQTTRRSLARIEEVLLAFLNRVFVAPDRLAGIAPAWLITACAAARTEPVFRKGGAGLVAAAGRSHEHVCRAMRRHLGMTPTAYVNRIRIERAAQLLDGTDLAIATVAERVGIDNLGHFYRLFGLQYGTTPRAYRLHHQRDPVAQA